MRTEWIPLSAAALVTGAMALVLGALLNPLAGDPTPIEALQIARREDARWMGMAIAYFAGSVALRLGMPTVLSLFALGARRLGIAGVAIFSIGIVGMAGFAMLLVFYRALLVHGALRGGAFEDVAADSGLTGFLYVWLGGFMLGLLLIAVGLVRVRRTPLWVPGLLVLFLLLTPFASRLGQTGSAIQLLALAGGFTGIATTASSAQHRAELLKRLA
jgi:hypothetical protein